MDIWTFLVDFWGSLIGALSPVFMYEFGGFTYWQYGLFAFLFASFVRFFLPLVGGANISGFGSILKDQSDTVKPSGSPSGISNGRWFWT